MGVKGLWQVIEALLDEKERSEHGHADSHSNIDSLIHANSLSTSTPASSLPCSITPLLTTTDIKAELKGKFVAVDVSIWLYHFIKTIPEGKHHLIVAGLFQRICRLLFFGAKPVFVVDGAAPTLKKETVEGRARLRQKGEADYAKVAKRILKAKLQLRALGAVGERDKGEMVNTSTSTSANATTPPIDLLASLESSSSDFFLDADEEAEADEYESFQSVDAISSLESLTESIDIYSPEFRKLPFALQERIILGHRRQNLISSKDDSHSTLLSSSNTASNTAATLDASLKFSLAQVETLLKRRQLMDELESLRGNKQLKRASGSVEVGRVAGRAGAKYLFVKNEETAGWTLSLGNGLGDDDKESKINSTSVTAAEHKEKTVSDIEDDKEFLEMMFGDEKGGEGDRVDGDGKSDHVEEEIEQSDVMGSTTGKEADVKDYTNISIAITDTREDAQVTATPATATSVPTVHEISSDSAEDEAVSVILNEKDPIDLVDTVADSVEEVFDLDELKTAVKDRSTLPEYVLEGLLKPTLSLEAPEVEFSDSSDSSDEEFFLNQQIPSTAADYDQLVASLNAQVSELSALRTSTLLSAATPTKPLTDALLQLLHLMGLPFIQAPFEAEAQCCAIAGIEGVISEDSDCLLFGAPTVYTNLFSKTKAARVVKLGQALKREHLILLAQLLGCDYCAGVAGIGVKRATQILKFMLHESTNGADQSPSELMRVINAKFPNWNIPEQINDRLVEAFMRPIVKEVRVDELQWKSIQEGKVVEFMRQQAKWEPERTLKLLQDIQK